MRKTAKKKRRKPPLNIEAINRALADNASAKRAYVAGILSGTGHGMPAATAQEAKARAEAIKKSTGQDTKILTVEDALKQRAKEIRPVKNALEKWKPWSSNKGQLDSFWLHPLETLNKLLPFKLGLGIGRKAKRKQIADTRAELSSKEKAMKAANFEQNIIRALGSYEQNLGNAARTVQKNRDISEFNSRVKQADHEFKTAIWGPEGIMTKYMVQTGRTKERTKTEGINAETIPFPKIESKKKRRAA